MYPSLSGIGAAELRRQELLAEVASGHRRLADPRGASRAQSARFSMTTLKLTARYARYLLTSLATVAFGLYAN